MLDNLLKMTDQIATLTIARAMKDGIIVPKETEDESDAQTGDAADGGGSGSSDSDVGETETQDQKQVVDSSGDQSSVSGRAISKGPEIEQAT